METATLPESCCCIATETTKTFPGCSNLLEHTYQFSGGSDRQHLDHKLFISTHCVWKPVFLFPPSGIINVFIHISALSSVTTPHTISIFSTETQLWQISFKATNTLCTRSFVATVFGQMTTKKSERINKMQHVYVCLCVNNKTIQTFSQLCKASGPADKLNLAN